MQEIDFRLKDAKDYAKLSFYYKTILKNNTISSYNLPTLFHRIIYQQLK